MTCIFDRGHLFTNTEWLARSQVCTLKPWWPQRCLLTKKWIWIKAAIRVRRVITGPGTPIVVDHWIESKAYTLQCLKGWD